MQNDVITLSDVLYRIDKGERFDMEAVAADKKRGTGGRILKLSDCILYTAFRRDRQDPVLVTADPDKVSRNPNHYENSTRNIYIMAERKTRKIHLRLITRFNGKRVL